MVSSRNRRVVRPSRRRETVPSQQRRRISQAASPRISEFNWERSCKNKTEPGEHPPEILSPSSRATLSSFPVEKYSSLQNDHKADMDTLDKADLDTQLW